MLEGPYGAYNKYDDDLTKGIIIKKLEEIGSKMDMIIANQEKAYCVRQKIQKNVEEMECRYEKYLPVITRRGWKIE